MGHMKSWMNSSKTSCFFIGGMDDDDLVAKATHATINPALPAIQLVSVGWWLEGAVRRYLRICGWAERCGHSRSGDSHCRRERAVRKIILFRSFIPYFLRSCDAALAFCTLPHAEKNAACGNTMRVLREPKMIDI